MTTRVTMKDIADRCEVSLSTVSLVLRDKPGISPEIRKTVIDAARALGYQKRYLVEGPGEQGLNQIGLLVKSRVDDLPHANHFYSHVMAGIEAACRRRQINLLYATLPVDESNHPTDLPRMLSDEQVDGILLIGAFADDMVIRLVSQRALPIVLVDAYSSSAFYDAVVSDNARGAYQAVSHLVERGHRHIAILGSTPAAYPSIVERRQAYERALQDRGIAERYYADCALHGDEAYPRALELLRSQPQVTAIFGANDDVAIAAMRAAHSLGRQVPEQLSIVGFDNIDLAQHMLPALTTMHVDKLAMGRLAVQLLSNRIEAPESASVTALITPQLVERASVKELGARS